MKTAWTLFLSLLSLTAIAVLFFWYQSNTVSKPDQGESLAGSQKESEAIPARKQPAELFKQLDAAEMAAIAKQLKATQEKNRAIQRIIDNNTRNRPREIVPVELPALNRPTRPEELAENMPSQAWLDERRKLTLPTEVMDNFTASTGLTKDEIEQAMNPD